MTAFAIAEYLLAALCAYFGLVSGLAALNRQRRRRRAWWREHPGPLGEKGTSTHETHTDTDRPQHHPRGSRRLRCDGRNRRLGKAA